jgi:type IV pilus assembly protein PilB
MHPARLRLGQLLVDARILTAEQLDEVLSLQKTDGRKLGALLVESGLVTETLLTQVLSQQLSVPWVSLNHIDFSRELLNLVPIEVAEKYCLVPIYVRAVRGQGDTLYVAMEDPMNEEALRDCAATSGLPTRAMIAATSDIFRALRLHYGSEIGAATSAVIDAAPVAAASVVKAAVGAPPAIRAPAPPRPPVPIGDAMQKSSKDDGSRAHEPSSPHLDAAMEEHNVEEAALPTGDSPDEAPTLEVGEVDISQRRKRGRQLTLLDGTTIKLPTAVSKKRTTGRRRSEPSPGAESFSAADLLAALRAASHGVDSTDMLGETLRWEKVMAAVLALLLRKHLILERELLEELKKI